MYNIEFYEDANGHSELWDFLEELRLKAATNKDARIQLKQISLYIQFLEDNGTRLNENITKHLDDDIWELRPGNNRVLYFYFKDDTFVLLHQFRKKTQKTPIFVTILTIFKQESYGDETTHSGIRQAGFHGTGHRSLRRKIRCHRYGNATETGAYRIDERPHPGLLRHFAYRKPESRGRRCRRGIVKP